MLPRMTPRGDSPAGQPKARHIGGDRVEMRGDRLTVITPVRHMAGWEVRRYRAPLIRFDGRTWRITKRTTGADKMTRYELEAWEPWEGEQTGPEIDYTPEYVVLRDHALAIGRRRGRVTVLLNAVSPLTGFLPARAKARLETTYGIDPVASTSWSVFIEFLVTLAALALVSIAQMVGAFGYRSGIPAPLILTIGVLAAVDGAVRWGRVFAEERPAPGFYEWLFKRPGSPRH